MADLANILAIALPSVKHGEGLRLEAYPDPLSGGDPWTIGYGATGEGIVRGVVWTEAQAEADLHARLTALAGELNDGLAWWTGLDDVRAAALLEMAYNLGVAGVRGFHNMLQALRAGEYTQAAADALSSRWAAQVGSRARRIAMMIRTGIAPGWPKETTP